MLHARQANAVVGEDVAVVFQVLAELGLAGIFQPGLQFGEHVLARQLFGCVLVVVRHRNVGSTARLAAQRDADQLGLHRIQRGGLGIDGGQFGGVDGGDPLIQLRIGEHGLVLDLGRRSKEATLGRRFQCCSGAGTDQRGLGTRRLATLAQFAQPGAEVVAGEEILEHFLVDRLHGQRFEDRLHVLRQIAIGLDRDQHAALRQPVQGLAQIFADHAGDLVGIGHDAIERAIGGEPLHGGLGTALFDAGYVVDGVADEAQVIDDALGGHAEFCGHAGNVENFIAHRVDQGNVFVDQLGHVLVAGGNDGVQSGGGGLYRERADDVIGLDALDHQDRPTQGAHGGVDRFDLQCQVFRHGFAGSLVVGIEIITESLALGVEHTGNVTCGIIVAQSAQHIDDAVQRTGGRAFRVTHIGQCMEGPIEVTGTIN